MADHRVKMQDAQDKRVVLVNRRVVIVVPGTAVVSLQPTGLTEVANHLLKVAVVQLRSGLQIVMPIKRSSLTATSNHHEKARQMTGFCLLVTAHCAFN